MENKRWLIPLYFVVAVGLAALTCWAFGINPWPSLQGWSRDPGWFLTFLLVYFFALLIGVEKIARARRRKK
jgi:sterol desaturase/sphingolipid hydroxylase (fatty acid hydroxylase superfamily)